MHELSIVEALIEQVQREVQRAGQRGRVQRLELSIGRLSGVSCDSLRFAFELLAPGTLVEEAKVSIHQPKASCRCHACGAVSEIDEISVRCPKCGSMEVVVEGGRDLLLQSIDLED
jgi:hydrogenase nickel incorporation protein HypA/HybF